MTSATLDAALKYHARGWCVMPLRGKVPIIKGWHEKDGPLAPEITLGHENTLKRWFEGDANIGICTGPESGLLVLDIDGAEGETWLSNNGFVVPLGPTVRTAKGRHAYFCYPDGALPKNAVRIAPKIDIRAAGGQVVAPPSIHPDTRIAYEWIGDSEKLPLPECPQWLLNLLTAKNAPSAKTTVTQDSGILPVLTEGQRNAEMHRIASSMRGNGFAEVSILAALKEENQFRCKPPLPAKEIETISRSVGKYPAGASSKKVPPPPVTVDEILPLLQTFDSELGERPDLIGGMFRRGYPSILVSEPGLGKSVLIQRLICDLSLGGALLDGYSTSKPMSTMLFCGEAGLGLLNYRLKLTGWHFDQSRISVCDARKMWAAGVDLTLSNDTGRDAFRDLIDAKKPDLVIIDSLGSFIDDESDRPAVKDIFDFLMKIADKNRCALLLVHHLRKRKNTERALPLDMSEVIGSSILTRHAALIVGMERRATPGGDLFAGSNQSEIFVHSLKSWDKPIPPLSFTIRNEDGGGVEKMVVRFNANPQVGDGKQARVWETIATRFGDGTEFRKSDLERVCEGVSTEHIKKLLTEWTKLGRLYREGSNKSTVYRIVLPLGGVGEGKKVPASSSNIANTESQPGTPKIPGVPGETEIKATTGFATGYSKIPGEVIKTPYDNGLEPPGILPVPGAVAVIAANEPQPGTPGILPVPGWKPALPNFQTSPGTNPPSLLDMLGEEFPDEGSEVR